jgi:hypothetical protein
MLIERLELYNLNDEKVWEIEFAKNKLNLILGIDCQPENHIGKLIAIILYGQQKASAGPYNSYKTASLNLDINGSHITVTRDFITNEAKAFDNNNNQSLSVGKTNSIGQELTNLSLESFQSTCFPFIEKNDSAEKMLSALQKHCSNINTFDLQNGDNGSNGSHSEAVLTSSAEYFDLCFQLTETDRDLLVAQEDLKSTIKRVHSSFRSNLLDKQESIENLWHEHENLKLNIEKINNNIQAKNLDLEELDSFADTSSHWLQQFTQADANELATVASEWQNLLTNLENTKGEKELELKHVQAEGVNADELSELNQIRKVLLNLEPQELENIRSYIAIILANKQKITESENATWRARTLQTEISEKRKGLSDTIQKMAFATGVIAFALLGAIFFVHTSAQILQILLSLVIIVFIGLIITPSLIKKHYKIDLEREAKLGEQTQVDLGQELHSKIASLEVKLEDAARKVGLKNGIELTQYVEKHTDYLKKTNNLDKLEQLIVRTQTKITELKNKLEHHFNKIKESVDSATPQSVLELAKCINHHLSELEDLKSGQNTMEEQIREQKFLRDRLRKINENLIEIFSVLGFSNNLTVDETYKQYCQILEESESESAKPNPNISTQELNNLIREFEHKGVKIIEKMKTLIRSTPEISQSIPSITSGRDATFSAQLSGKQTPLILLDPSQQHSPDQLLPLIEFLIDKNTTRQIILLSNDKKKYRQIIQKLNDKFTGSIHVCIP